MNHSNIAGIYGLERAGTAVSALAVMLWLSSTADTAPPQVIRFEINAPAGSTLRPGTPAVSPDGWWAELAQRTD